MKTLENALNKIFKREYYPYRGEDPAGEVSWYCYKCKQKHLKPKKDWVMYKAIPGTWRLACKESVVDDGYEEVSEGS